MSNSVCVCVWGGIYINKDPYGRKRELAQVYSRHALQTRLSLSYDTHIPLAKTNTHMTEELSERQLASLESSNYSQISQTSIQQSKFIATLLLFPCPMFPQISFFSSTSSEIHSRDWSCHIHRIESASFLMYCFDLKASSEELLFCGTDSSMDTSQNTIKIDLLSLGSIVIHLLYPCIFNFLLPPLILILHTLFSNSSNPIMRCYQS